jgi:hypothetical protein
MQCRSLFADRGKMTAGKQQNTDEQNVENDQTGH